MNSTERSIESIKISKDFKKQAVRCIYALIFFGICYIILLLLALVLTVASVYAGIMIIITVPRIITILLGLGLASLGLLILIFLIKFIFKSNKVDRSHLTEITRAQEPQLFAMLDDLVQEVGTHFPKRVYISPEVNAYVFYDSSFWSMFFPVKKNLMIGIGLVNTTTVSELKAILAHEFGHFSQRTMKVGSYVYNVNQVIHNMLYDNNSFEKLVQSWSSIAGVIAICVLVAVKIIEGIQWLLQQLYKIVNKSYMALSRQMEFHADEIAAHITGYPPLKNALLRMSLADHSFNSVIAYYNSKIDDGHATSNFFRDQAFVMNFNAKQSDITYNHEFPLVTLEDLNKFNKSKLMIEDQWASHPSVEQRIAHLESTKIIKTNVDSRPASVIFSDIEATAKLLTEEMFKGVEYQSSPEYLSLDQFKEGFEAQHKDNSFSEVYNGYYDDKNPSTFDLNEKIVGSQNLKTKYLFSDEMIDKVLLYNGLKNDIEVISGIADKSIKIKSFDYDGKKYRNKEAKQLLSSLKPQMEKLEASLLENDKHIYAHFHGIASAQGKEEKLKELYQNFFNLEESIKDKSQLMTDLYNGLDFVNRTTPVEEIQANFIAVRSKENRLKKEIEAVIVDPDLQESISSDMRKNFELFLSENWKYFSTQNYLEKNLQMLFMAINDYHFLVNKLYFKKKKALLAFQATL